MIQSIDRAGFLIAGKMLSKLNPLSGLHTECMKVRNGTVVEERVEGSTCSILPPSLP